MTTSSELELARAHLQRAEELAQFFGHTAEEVGRINLLKRATEKIRGELNKGLKRPLPQEDTSQPLTT